MPCLNRKTWFWLLFGVYCLLMLWLLLFHRIGAELMPFRYNLRPWDTINRYLWVLRHSASDVQRRYAAVNLVGNVVLFLPFGVFLPTLFPKLRTFLRFFLTAVITILVVELLQLFSGLGALDVDDVSLNLLGIFSGFLLWRMISACNGKL